MTMEVQRRKNNSAMLEKISVPRELYLLFWGKYKTSVILMFLIHFLNFSFKCIL